MRSGHGSRRTGSEDPASPGERLPRSARIGNEEEFRRTLRRGDRRIRGPLEVYRASSLAGRPRIGVVVPLHGRGAVERNRLRRRLREVLRTEWLPGAWKRCDAVDLVVRTRPAAYELSFPELRAHLLEALEDGV